MTSSVRSSAIRAAVMLVVAAGACTGVQNATVTTSQACAALAQARCAQTHACAPDLWATRWTDEASCEAAETQQCGARLVARGSADDAYSIGACAAVYGQDGGYPCAWTFANEVPAACRPRSGTLVEGAICAFDSQCDSAHCALAAGAACGRCGPPPVAHVGDACTDDVPCGPGLVCNARGRCIAEASLVAGAWVCDPDTLPCPEGLWCVGGSATASGTCVAAATSVGAPCDATGQANPGCARGLGLVCSNGTCAAVADAKLGDACGGDVRCALGSACSGGMCVATAAVGAACDLAKGPPCAYPARCVVASGGTSGTCAMPDARACEAAADAGAE